mmetsp:Transcript_67437/g.124214  ORF Transcript_67437/g.124214 Transcript_67437/m.124214 type:complete len:315 (+) Transcript_67437:64-1008(+)
MYRPAFFAHATLLCTIHVTTGLLRGGQVPPTVMKEAGGTKAQEAASMVSKYLGDLNLVDKRSLWWHLTQDIQLNNGWPILGDKPMWPEGTGTRALIEEWNQHAGTEITKTHHTQTSDRTLRCAETGDGHFLRDGFADVCGETLVVDLFDSAADVQMDLNQPPPEAPERVKEAMNTMDIVVSHQVFEHLQRPSVGIANLNALLKVGGTLVLSTPFVTPDHQGPGDDFLRWTVRGLHNFAKCAGFDVQVLRGLGDRFEEIAYLAGVRADMMGSSHMGVGCDGLASDDCKDLFFAAVAVLGTKRESKTVQEIHECFG